MTGNWILILGANSDIAIATARRFAQSGNHIYLASRGVEELEKEAANLEIRYKVQAKACRFDALDFNSHQGFYESLSPPPTGTVLAFGLLGEQENSQQNFSKAKEVLDTNFIGAVSILEIVARAYEAKRSGFIVGISSVAGDRGRKSNYIYGSAKAGLTAYLAGLRHRLFKSGVSVLTVKPGFVATKMTAGMNLPTKLTAQPEQVAEAIYKAVQKNKNTIYVKWIWRYIMQIIVNVPEFIFKKTNM